MEKFIKNTGYMRRKFNYMKDKKVGIALGNGGAKGISHIGILEVLEKNNIKIDEISGCSIGAIVGGAYAAGVSIEKMKEIAFSINLKKTLNLFDFTNPSTGGIVKGKIVEEFLEDILPVRRFENLKIPFKCVATDIKSGKEVIFDKGDLVPAIRASISIPGFFMPYEYQGKLLVDGGVINPVPVNLLDKSDYKIAVVVQEYKKIKKWSKRKMKIETKIKKFLNERFSPIIKYLPDYKKRNKKSGMINILSSTIDIMSNEILEFNLNNYNVNLIIKPAVDNIAALGFYDGYKSYLKGIKATEDIMQKIKL